MDYFDELRLSMSEYNYLYGFCNETLNDFNETDVFDDIDIDRAVSRLIHG